MGVGSASGAANSGAQHRTLGTGESRAIVQDSLYSSGGASSEVRVGAQWQRLPERWPEDGRAASRTGPASPRNSRCARRPVPTLLKRAWSRAPTAGFEAVQTGVVLRNSVPRRVSDLAFHFVIRCETFRTCCWRWKTLLETLGCSASPGLRNSRRSAGRYPKTLVP